MLKSQLAQALQLPKHERVELDVFLRSLDADGADESADQDHACDRMVAGLRARLATRSGA
jgi:hypothetical protein